MTVIGFIRHGQTDWNIAQRAQGQTDVPLNAEGLRQAHLLAERMRGEHWDYVYSSDLSRAFETARLAASGIGGGLEVKTDRRLREICLGEIEGTTEEERIQRWGKEWYKLDLGLEARESVAARGVEAAEEIAARHPGKRILLVSHGGLIGSTLKKLIPEALPEFVQIHNTSVTVLRKSDEGWSCELYNCTRHLNGSGETEEAAG